MVWERVLFSASDEGQQYGHSRRCGSEVLDGQPRHLREEAHRRFAAVGLPVRIGHEADGGIEGQIGGDGGESVGIERQESLEPLQQINGKKSRQTENEQSPGVGLPGHFLFLIDPAASVNPSFQGTGEPA